MPAKAAGRQDEMAPALPTIPPRIGTGVRVKTRKKPCRAGTIVEAVGNREWKVKFDGKDVVDEEIFSSQKLQINQRHMAITRRARLPPRQVETLAKLPNLQVRRRQGNFAIEEVGRYRIRITGPMMMMMMMMMMTMTLKPPTMNHCRTPVLLVPIFQFPDPRHRLKLKLLVELLEPQPMYFVPVVQSHPMTMPPPQAVQTRKTISTLRMGKITMI